MLAELLEHDHRQQARAGPSPWDGMEWRWRLANLLTVAAGKLLPHRLDHLPLTGYRFQRTRHVFAELAKATAAAALAVRGRIDQHPFAWKMLRERLALSALARKSAHGRRLSQSPFGCQFVFSGVGFQLFERKRQLVDQPR